MARKMHCGKWQQKNTQRVALDESNVFFFW